MKKIFLAGLAAGLQTTWTLGKVIFPVTLLVTLLQHTPVMDWLIRLITPVMGLFGLSGEAAIPLVLGNMLNLYAGIAGILTLDLSVKEVFILAVMLSFCHNLIIESTVAAKVGIRIGVILAVRIGLAAVSAIVINLIWHGGQETAQYGFITAKSAAPDGWLAMIAEALMKAGLGVLQLAAIVIPLMIIIQLLRDLGWLHRFSRWLSPFTQLLGMNKNTSMTMVAGLTIGLAYGAGVMIKAVEDDGVSRRDMTLAFIFLVACHAVVEDTLVFIPLGIPVWPLLLIRVTTAVLLTMAIAHTWKKWKPSAVGKEAI
ncbi:nucleoside recognition domain-containing protein [Bacillus vallismortis]|uniref:Nucleoside recognition domain-containing protein n=1 Tax=Bacillus vallismortis TaxID=72361 RepID=A0AAP3CGE1_BACVA|nr:nucleoside recognition domain-containing protein [Bacillus vallismortis]MCY7916058.1 nucleoside recognition domain-containing protein [Bacillus vallismortis]MCY8316014.1 nucleoside recognition domain-containing protein [Bacillus vallismortis]MEC1651799.1 nucleoside recognition domain-containing protein [Bacillus vallismortis]MEC1792596.1 nucleoside recognition domain-containing protein [Bacillus vallismortis]